jgi:D-xylose transport system permease protein
MTTDQGGNVDSPTPGAENAPGTQTAPETETKSAPSAVLPPEAHDGHHEEETPAAVALVSVAPELLADSLGEYVKAWVKRIRSGESGALPILLGLVVIVIIFQVQQSRFLSAGNIVNLLVQAAFFVTLGLGEVFVLILSEIDLSTGFVAGIGATITLALLSPSYGWPWWAAVIVGLLACAAIGAFQGLLITRLHLPSFVVTLASLLGLGGVLIFLFDSFHGAVGGVISLPISGPLYNLVNGNMSVAASWIVLVVAVALYGLVSVMRNTRRRARNLSAPPLSITLATVAVVGVAGALLVIVCNINRGNLTSISGVPWVLPLVLLLVVLWTLLLSKTRTGRYIYAIGASPEAARRAGIRVQWIRTVAFILSAFTAGLGGLVFASRLGSISVGYDGSTYVLYAIAAAVIGGASLFGGYGKAVHALLGGVLIAAVVNGLALIGVSTAGEEIATALVLLAAVTVDSLVRRRGSTT